MSVIGGKELQKKLATLGERVQRKVTRQAINAAANPVLKSARGKAKKQSGLLKKSLGKKIVTSKDKTRVTAIIGARKQVQGEYKGKLRKPSRYSHLVEKGFINEHGEHVPPQPFLDPAARESESQAMSIMQNKLADGVIREAMRSA